MKKGTLLTIEGIEGAGKSSVIQLIRRILKRRGVLFVHTREPGGTYIGDCMREVLLSKKVLSFGDISSMAELLLILAGRNQNIKDTILPGIYSGYTVLCDRFTDTTISYQGAGRGLRIKFLKSILQSTGCLLRPDITVLLDLPVIIGRSRIKDRGNFDRIEEENTVFFDKVQECYTNLAKKHPDRFIVIKAEKSIYVTSALIFQTLNLILEHYE